MPVQTTAPAAKVEDYTVTPQTPMVVDSQEDSAPQAIPSRNPGKKPLSLGEKLELVQNNWVRLWNIARKIGEKAPDLVDGFNRDLALWNETAKKEDPQTRFENRRTLVIAISLSILKYQLTQAEDLKIKAEKFHAVPDKVTGLLDRAKNDHAGTDWSRAFAATEAVQLLSNAIWTSGQLHWLRKKVEAMPSSLPDRKLILDKIIQARNRICQDPIGANRTVDSLKASVNNLESQRVAYEQEQSQGLAQIQAVVSRQAKNGNHNHRRDNHHQTNRDENKED